MLGFAQVSNVAVLAAAVAGPTYDAASDAYFAAMTAQPDATRKGLIDTLITGLKADGVWALLDLLALPAAHDAQAGLINAVNPAQICTVAGTMTFTADRGYAGDGTTGYISTVTNETAWAKFSQNSLCFGAYLNVNATTTLYMGEAAGLTARMTPSTGTNMQARVGSTTSIQAANAVGTGLFTANRSDSSNAALYRNGGLVASSSSNTSAALNAEPLLAGRVATVYSTARVAAIVIGASLDATKQAALYTRLNTYLAALGAN